MELLCEVKLPKSKCLLPSAQLPIHRSRAEFLSDQPGFGYVICDHKCGSCGTRVSHKTPYGPALPYHCRAPFFLACFNCRVPANPEKLEKLDAPTRAAIKRIERRFARFKALKNLGQLK